MRTTKLLLLAAAVCATLGRAADARVLSYAPYTNRAALPSYNDRTSRYFALVEGDNGIAYNGVTRAQVVLYDATGATEPRVIYPTAFETATVSWAAVWQPESNLLVSPTPEIAPIILIATYDATSQPMYMLSADGGEKWTRVKDLDGKFSPVPYVADFGGPFTHGMRTQISVGGGTYAFALATGTQLWGIDAYTGKTKLLFTSTATDVLVGRNLDGRKLLVRSAADRLAILDTDSGTVTEVATDLPPNWPYAGWIASDSSVYLYGLGERRLSLYRNGTKQIIGAAYPSAPLVPDSVAFFAIPTFDYDGAWMIQRENGKPTTLSRHTLSGAVQTFWSDVSGPQVEALHTSRYSDALLIQVHRPRAQSERWFLDPALAVWRPGQPAPKRYDELFLNEGYTKGFVHLDVEKIETGQPFVFDSGSVPGPQIISSPGGGADVVQEWGVVRASLKQRLVFPGVARQGGQFGSYWLTDVVVHNPFPAPQDVTFRFVPIGEEPQAAATMSKAVTLEPNEIRVIRDVLHELFGLDHGGGALFLEPAAGVTATSRTYTQDAKKGSFGFGMQAIETINAASARFPVTFAGAFPGAEYRTNMILTDTSGRGTEARLTAHGLSGKIGLDNVAFSAPRSGLLQLNGVAGELGVGAGEGALSVQPLTGTAIATVVAMDNRTNDPTYFPPDLPAPDVRTIPVIGHVDGAFGSKFRSDLFLFNPDSAPRTVQLEAKAWDSTEQPRVVPFTLLPGEARVIRDVLSTMFQMTGVARLRYHSGEGNGVRVTSRTYNVREDGGTLGCLIPPLNSFQSAGPGEMLEIIGVVGGTGFRTNVGLVELTRNSNGSSADVRITIYDDRGKRLESFTVAPLIGGGMQINDLFAARGIEQPAAARITIEVTKGLVGAYATLTDNVTNDATYLGAQLASSDQ